MRSGWILILMLKLAQHLECRNKKGLELLQYMIEIYYMIRITEKGQKVILPSRLKISGFEYRLRRKNIHNNENEK